MPIPADSKQGLKFDVSSWSHSRRAHANVILREYLLAHAEVRVSMSCFDKGVAELLLTVLQSNFKRKTNLM